MKPVHVRLGNAVGWLLVPMAALMQLVGLQRPMFGPTLPAPELIGYVAITAVTAPWVVARRRELTGAALVVGGAFALLVAYGAVGVVLRPAPTVVTSEEHVIPWYALAYPLASALFAMTAAFGLVMAVERHARMRVFVAAGAAMLVAGAVSWPSQVGIHRSWRFATGMAGSATIHVALLVVAAAAIGWFLTDRRRWLGLVVGAGAAFAFLATGSRAGLVSLVVLGALVLLVGGSSGLGRRVRVLGVAGLAVIAGVALLVFPELQRMVQFSDPLRATNLASALDGWLSTPVNTMFGVGYGQVWPWYAFDADIVAAPGARMVTSPFGEVLLSPHSTLLAVATELGLVGLLAAGALVVALVLAVRPRAGRAGVSVLGAAVVACLASFLFDTYLLKNFGVSFWWWAAVALVCLVPPEERAVGANG